jgi:hypothetical protein
MAADSDGARSALDAPFFYAAIGLMFFPAPSVSRHFRVTTIGSTITA